MTFRLALVLRGDELAEVGTAETSRGDASDREVGDLIEEVRKVLGVALDLLITLQERVKDGNIREPSTLALVPAVALDRHRAATIKQSEQNAALAELVRKARAGFAAT